MTMSTFDAFLSYSRKDENEAVALRKELEQRGLHVWFDKTEILPGDRWQPKMEEGLQNSKAVLFLYGPSGTGPWQEVERFAAMVLEVTEGRRLIPILLPRGKIPEDLPILLRGLACVSFKTSVSENAVLDSLVLAITGRRPESPKPVRKQTPVPGTSELLEDAVKYLAGALASGPVTFFLGPNILSGQDASYPPRVSDIVGHLILESGLIKDCPKDPPCFPRDLACDYFSAQQPEQLLEDKVTEVIQEQSRQIPRVHEKLADLLAKTLQTRGTTRRQNNYPQLIVTTNLDVLMERALLGRGVPFTRLVVNLIERTMEINQYWEEVQNGPEAGEVVLAAGLSQRRLDDDELDDFIRDHGRSLFDPRARDDGRKGESSPRGLEGQPIIGALPHLDRAPVLVKYCGSVDLRGTCTLSNERTMEIVASGVNLPKIGAIISNTAWLFLGYDLFDPELRLLCHTLLREPRNTPGRQRGARYAVLPRPTDDPVDTARQMEGPIWGNVKRCWTDWRSVTQFVDSRVDTFLDKLMNEVSRASGQ